MRVAGSRESPGNIWVDEIVEGEGSGEAFQPIETDEAKHHAVDDLSYHAKFCR
jgi:hypothetical protein